MPLTTSCPLREMRFQRACPSLGVSCWRLNPCCRFPRESVIGPRTESFTGSFWCSSATRSPDTVKIRIVHDPGGSPRKSMWVPVGSEALGVRSHDDERSAMLRNPRYGFGTTHTPFLPLLTEFCGTTPSASTAERRPYSSPPPDESPAVTE